MIYFGISTKNENEDQINTNQRIHDKKMNNVDLGDMYSALCDELEKLTKFKVFQASVFNDEIDVSHSALEIDNKKIGYSEDFLKKILYLFSYVPLRNNDNKSLDDCGLEIQIYKHIKNCEVDKTIVNVCSSKNLQVLNEEILWKNMDNTEKAEVFSKYLININSKNNSLLIFDPYLFSSKDSDYCTLLSQILNLAEPKSVTAITSTKHYNEDCYKEICKSYGNNIKLIYCEDIQDRFWIVNNKKGICCGTSLNGVGKKISSIQNMTEDDVTDLIVYVKKELRLDI